MLYSWFVYIIHDCDRRLLEQIQSVNILIALTAAQDRIINSIFITLHCYLMLLWTQISFLSKTLISALAHSMEWCVQKDMSLVLWMHCMNLAPPILKCPFIIKLSWCTILTSRGYRLNTASLTFMIIGWGFLREKCYIDPQVPLHAVTNTSSVDKDRICAAFSWSIVDHLRVVPFLCRQSCHH